MISLNNNRQAEEFVVVHPLLDQPERKCDATELGLMKMTPQVRFLLILLRAYLAIVGLLLGYHLLDLAGFLHRVH